MTAGSTVRARLGRDDERLAGRSGAGVSVAVLDSGLNPGNPHVEVPLRTTSLHPSADGEDADVLDRLGHGTAVAAAIHEKAPAADLHVVKIFHETLSTDTPTLVRGIERAVADGARVVNLSLGTAEDARRGELDAPLARAREAGALVISPREHRGRRWWPGSLPEAVGVLLDWECPRHELRLMRGPEGEPVFRASGFPRPVPGVPRARNVKGISFAVANVTGLLALVLEAAPGISTVEEVAEWIERA